MAKRNTRLYEVERRLVSQIDAIRHGISPKLARQYKNATPADRYRMLAEQARNRGQFEVELLFDEFAARQEELDAQLMLRQAELEAELKAEYATVAAEHQAGILKEAFERGASFRSWLTEVFGRVRRVWGYARSNVLRFWVTLLLWSDFILFVAFGVGAVVITFYAMLYGLLGHWLVGCLFGLAHFGTVAIAFAFSIRGSTREKLFVTQALLCVLFLLVSLFYRVMGPGWSCVAVMKEHGHVTNVIKGGTTVFMPAPKWWKGSNFSLEWYNPKPNLLVEEWQGQKVGNQIGTLNVRARFELQPGFEFQKEFKTEAEYQEDIRSMLKTIVQQELALEGVDFGILKDRLQRLGNPGYCLKDVVLTFSPDNIIIK